MLSFALLLSLDRSFRSPSFIILSLSSLPPPPPPPTTTTTAIVIIIITANTIFYGVRAHTRSFLFHSVWPLSLSSLLRHPFLMLFDELLCKIHTLGVCFSFAKCAEIVPHTLADRPIIVNIYKFFWCVFRESKRAIKCIAHTRRHVVRVCARAQARARTGNIW